MNEDRRFARLRRGVATDSPDTSVVPENGMCLSAFLVVRPKGEDRKVLLGHLDPHAPWSWIGALDSSRLSRIGQGWMLPSSQLLLFESPQEAARRIAREQLETDLPPIETSGVFSEAYPSQAHPTGDPHWDFHFVFQVRWPSAQPPRAYPWKELAFVDLNRLRREEIARFQGDVLELAGLPPGPRRGWAGRSPPSGTERTRRR